MFSFLWLFKRITEQFYQKKIRVPATLGGAGRGFSQRVGKSALKNLHRTFKNNFFSNTLQLNYNYITIELQLKHWFLGKCSDDEILEMSWVRTRSCLGVFLPLFHQPFISFYVPIKIGIPFYLFSLGSPVLECIFYFIFLNYLF